MECRSDSRTLSLKQRAQLQGYLEDQKSEDEILRPFYRYGREQEPTQGKENETHHCR